MPLPYSYSNILHVPEIEGIKKQQFIDKFKAQLLNNDSIKKSSVTKHKIEFIYQSLFKIEYPVEILISEDIPKKIEYDIKLDKLILVCIVLVIFIAFFSSFTFSGFLWFSSVFTLVFYAINIFIIDKNLQNLINQCINNNSLTISHEEILSNEQLEWIKDKSKCPACGEDISEYDQNCPECGLKLREKARPKPYDVSKYENKRIKYHFKEKKKNLND